MRLFRCVTPCGTELDLSQLRAVDDIPGVNKEDIQVDIDDDQVSLRAEAKKEKEEKKGEKVVYSERSYGMVSRTLTLPGAVDEKGAKAEYKDGVLSLMLPKKSNGSAKRIAIT